MVRKPLALLWEQEVAGSNPVAPSSYCLASQRLARRHSLVIPVGNRGTTLITTLLETEQCHEVDLHRTRCRITNTPASTMSPVTGRGFIWDLIGTKRWRNIISWPSVSPYKKSHELSRRLQRKSWQTDSSRHSRPIGPAPRQCTVIKIGSVAF